MKKVDEMFDNALTFKKMTNIIACVLTFICGVTSVIYKVNYEGGFWTCFREMTVNGTVFSTIVALVLIIVNSWEIHKKQEIIIDFWYYMRLSSAVTETIIFVVVFVGYVFQNFFPDDNPVFFRYDMIMMHVLVPALVVFSFCVNDTPINIKSKWMRLNGAFFITLYLIVIETLIVTNVVPNEKIPYSFLDFKNTSIWFILFAFVVVYGISYLLSWLYIDLNKKVYWKSYSVKWMNRINKE